MRLVKSNCTSLSHTILWCKETHSPTLQTGATRPIELKQLPWSHTELGQERDPLGPFPSQSLLCEDNQAEAPRDMSGCIPWAARTPHGKTPGESCFRTQENGKRVSAFGRHTGHPREHIPRGQPQSLGPSDEPGHGVMLEPAVYHTLYFTGISIFTNPETKTQLLSYSSRC